MIEIINYILMYGIEIINNVSNNIYIYTHSHIIEK